MKLALRQTQRLVMTPLLQQAIQLLQLSTLELQEVVQRELLENPLLEETPETPETPESPDGAPGENVAATPEPPRPEATVADERRADDLPFDITAVMFDDAPEPSLVAPVQQAAERLASGNGSAAMRPGLDPKLVVLTVGGIAALASSAREMTRLFGVREVAPEQWRDHLFDLLVNGIVAAPK